MFDVYMAVVVTVATRYEEWKIKPRFLPIHGIVNCSGVRLKYSRNEPWLFASPK